MVAYHHHVILRAIRTTFVAFYFYPLLSLFFPLVFPPRWSVPPLVCLGNTHENLGCSSPSLRPSVCVCCALGGRIRGTRMKWRELRGERGSWGGGDVDGHLLIRADLRRGRIALRRQERSSLTASSFSCVSEPCSHRSRTEISSLPACLPASPCYFIADWRAEFVGAGNAWAE